MPVADVSLVSAKTGRDFNDFADLLDAPRTHDEEITAATAGVSSGATAIAALAGAGGFEYRMASQDSDNPTAIVTADGEAMVTTGLAVEQIELVRDRRLHALALTLGHPRRLVGGMPIRIATTVSCLSSPSRRLRPTVGPAGFGCWPPPVRWASVWVWRGSASASRR